MTSEQATPPHLGPITVGYSETYRPVKTEKKVGSRFGRRGPYKHHPRIIPKCHPERLNHCRGLCKECYTKLRYREQLKDPALVEKHRRQARESHWRHRDKEIKRMHERTLKQCGLTEDDYQTLLVLQDSKCAICEIHLDGSWHYGPQTDHDHKKCVARGLLCTNCNTRLGKIEDVAWRALADKYLAKFAKVDTKVENPEN